METIQGLNRWWRVVGGLSMNLALGTLYAWSVFVAPLEKQFGWKRADTSMVFTIAVMVFALTFVIAALQVAGEVKTSPTQVLAVGTVAGSLSPATKLTVRLYVPEAPRLSAPVVFSVQ